MRKIILILGCSISALAIPSCYYTLQKDYLEYIPYNGNEILIFQSDHNRMDTIFLEGMSTYEVGGGKSFNRYQIAKVDCIRTDPNGDRYYRGDLIKIKAAKNGGSRISFDITLKGAWFYNLNHYSLNEFNKMPDSVLTIGDRAYYDVKIFEADEYAKWYEGRDNYAERFYWSFSEGFLGLDKKDEKWRLIKKIIP